MFSPDAKTLTTTTHYKAEAEGTKNAAANIRKEKPALNPATRRGEEEKKEKKVVRRKIEALEQQSKRKKWKERKRKKRVRSWG